MNSRPLQRCGGCPLCSQAGAELAEPGKSKYLSKLTESPQRAEPAVSTTSGHAVLIASIQRHAPRDHVTACARGVSGVHRAAWGSATSASAARIREGGPLLSSSRGDKRNSWLAYTRNAGR